MMCPLDRIDQLISLQAVTASLAAARTPAEVAAVLARQGCAQVGATAAAIYLPAVDGAWLERVLPADQPPPVLAAGERLCVADPHPICQALRTGSVAWTDSDAARLDAGGTTAAVPLSVRDRIIGVITLNFSFVPACRETDVDAMHSLASVTAQALDRALLYTAALERARAAAELARERSQFVSDVCHELRTPLSTIIGFTQMLQGRSDQSDTEAWRDRLRRVILSAARQQRLINDLQVIGTLDAGILVPRREEVSLNSLARHAAAEVRDKYPGQHIVSRGPRNLRVVVDAERVVQVLTNLLDNAAKYSPEGSPISISWRAEGNMVVTRVRDQGPGVPVEGREHLFTRFGRIPGIVPRSGHVSTGLGLYLSRRLAKAMGGDLDLELTRPQGSTFRLRLPAASV